MRSWSDGISLDVRRDRFPHAAEGKSIYCRGGLRARQRTHADQEIAVESLAPPGHFAKRFIRSDARSENVVRAKSRAGIRKFPEALYKKTRGNDQHDGDGNFSNNQAAAEAMASTGVAPLSAGLERFCQVHARSACGRHDAENQPSENGECGGE